MWAKSLNILVERRNYDRRFNNCKFYYIQREFKVG